MGKICITGAFAVIYNHSAEFFPTVARQADTGSILAPQIILLVSSAAQIECSCVAHDSTSCVQGPTVDGRLPSIVYGAIACIAGGLCFIIPETHNRTLPETIGDGINFCLKSIMNQYFPIHA